VALARAQAERLKELTGPLQPVTAEPPGELLQAVTEEQKSNDAAQERQAELHYVLLS
jgi:hypothetical protein